MTDTGPPLPRPIPGGNAIGFFQIGVSPIGTISPFDPWATIISQYSNSPILDTLILDFFSNVDQTENFDLFFDLMWNIDTAQGYGLDVWGRILGVNRSVQLPGSQVYFGFEQGLPGVDTFGPLGQGPFYSGEPSTVNYNLTDAAFRQLLLAKAAFNISPCTIFSINALLMSLFPGAGTCYCTDGEDMTMTYTFNFALSPVQSAIVFQTGVLPKPCGVAATVVQA
jgi:hypothetical protein